MIMERSDFFQNAKFCPILLIYDSPDDQHVRFCMNSKFDAILQPVVVTIAKNWRPVITSTRAALSLVLSDRLFPSKAGWQQRRLPAVRGRKH